VDVDDHRWRTRSLIIRIGGRVVEPVYRSPIRGLPGDGFGLAEERRGQHLALAAGNHFRPFARNAQDARGFGSGLSQRAPVRLSPDAGLLDQRVGGGVDCGDLPGAQRRGCLRLVCRVGFRGRKICWLSGDHARRAQPCTQAGGIITRSCSSVFTSPLASCSSFSWSSSPALLSHASLPPSGEKIG